MNRLLYYIVLLPVSKLPYAVLYAVSDFLFFVLWYMVGYRKKVVLDNLEKCFPEKSSNEIKGIAKKFFHHLCDLVLESIKNFSITNEQATMRMTTLNPEVPNAFAEKGQSIMICGGHYGNWELWAMATPPILRHKVLGIYKKLSNPFFDKKMHQSRGRFGLFLLPTRETGDYLRQHTQELKAVVFAIDQSPANPKKCIWVNFLGRDTAAYFGTEKYARDFGYPIVYGCIRKVERGHYTVKYEVLTEHPAHEPEGTITQKLFDKLEDEIMREPAYWLWSHKRWKHKRNQELPGLA